jgi:phosphoribosylamine--glycine ligase
VNIAIVGGGGREHAIIKKIKENKSVEKIYALPGNAGMRADAICIDISPTDLENIKKIVIENEIDYCIVSPDDPLVLGLVDILQESGIECFGPEKKSAIIEGSKIFSKNLMKKYNIPTASYETFSEYESALKYLETMAMPVVIKADGLALGKGVTIAQNKEEAIVAIKSAMLDKKFGKSGENIVIEEFLKGVEVSVLTFTDGKTIVPMISSMDHKLSKDDDKGVNTGGMGTIAPNPYYTEKIAKQCMEKIFIPTINAMNSENRTFKGCLYFGLIITADGVKVIEYNCRFGDPETQVVLPLLKSDLLTIMQAVTRGTLEDVEVKFSDNSACCVVMASDGYPEKYDKGFEIKVTDEILDNVYFAGAIEKDGKLYTNSGRVLGVTGVDTTLKAAIEKSYDMLKQIDFENSYYRKDIGKKALKKEMEEK